MTAPNIKAILFDMDGVLYHGAQPLTGAISFVRAISMPIRFITNNPIKPPDDILKRLTQMGFKHLQQEWIITSAMATKQWLEQQKPNFRFFAIGAPGLAQVLGESGIEAKQDVDYVVVGEGPGLDYDSLSTAIELISNQGAQLIGTNPDLTVDNVHQGKHQILPGGGALIAPVIAATGANATIIGKPETLLYEMALTDLKIAATECLMIGDRPDTDILGAARLGMQTALVRTGRFLPGELYPSHLPKPTWDTNSLSELKDQLSNVFK